MHRIALLVALMLASIFPAGAQSEQGTIESILGPRNRMTFVFKPATNKLNCPSIDMSATTPQKAQRLGQTIFAEALLYWNTIGYLFLISNDNGPHEVYLATYTQRACAVDEARLHWRGFTGENRFSDAKAYYHSLLHEFSR